MKRRTAIWLGIAAAAVLVVAGVTAFGIYRQQQDLRTGHWVVAATPAPGQPAPTPPPGAFAFKDPGGNPIFYFPPQQAPVAITWRTSHDAQHAFSVDLPANWTQLDQSPVLPYAHMVCPPGADTQADMPGAPACITYGWVASFTTPSSTDPTVSSPRPVVAHGVTGYVYTESAMGTTITAVFPASGGGQVILTTFGNDDTLLYAFAHMLSTLTMP
jgi:hypothetical protein